MSYDFYYGCDKWFGDAYCNYNNDSGRIVWIIRFPGLNSIIISTYIYDLYPEKENNLFDLKSIIDNTWIGNFNIYNSFLKNIPYYFLLEIIDAVSNYRKYGLL